MQLPRNLHEAVQFLRCFDHSRLRCICRIKSARQLDGMPKLAPWSKRRSFPPSAGSRSSTQTWQTHKIYRCSARASQSTHAPTSSRSSRRASEWIDHKPAKHFVPLVGSNEAIRVSAAVRSLIDIEPHQMRRFGRGFIYEGHTRAQCKACLWQP